MRKSERFGLNLVEGSDIVNPLVQDVPNYEMIDEQMGKNADSSVPIATELLSGTVHALTRENPNASMFRFVATANFKTGDTFTVDGVQVTALLTTGEPLATGCYVINSNVLCCLVGTVLTMFCANSLSEIHAVDSEKLGGQNANYYASAESVVEAINLSQNANTISLSNSDKISKLGGFTPVIDDTGKITGYKTSVGGADTVFPFNSILGSKLFIDIEGADGVLTAKEKMSNCTVLLLYAYASEVNVDLLINGTPVKVNKRGSNLNDKGNWEQWCMFDVPHIGVGDVLRFSNNDMWYKSIVCLHQ